MARVDEEYHKLLETILKNGERHFDKSREVDTIQIPSYEFKLIDSISFPIITTKRIHWKSVLAELDMFIKGVTNIKFLLDRNVNIWNKDAYNYYSKLCAEQKKRVKFKLPTFIKACKMDRAKTDAIVLNNACPEGYHFGDLGPIYGAQWGKNDQLLNCIEAIKKREFNRRLIVNAWDSEDIPDMALPPCHWAFEFIKYKEGFILKWHQRSVDAFLGLPFNITSYSILGTIIANITGVPFRGIIGDLSNIHIYENHFDQVQEQLSRSVYTFSNRETDLYCSRNETNKMTTCQNGFMPIKAYLKCLDLRNFEIKDYESYDSIKAEMLAPIIKD